ncbi:MFS transporter [Microbacterium sp. SORGH_AS_0862]|uniref:MFS transporter n=1 Tax=Microbacterium sp. SORGH_AS_0862 TaxID=3041789 RepID=UPI0027925047|nr:MFS transporter [Microbacterium sp. SORGH_AS_0862]MDQ1205521.1 nucleoside transporter [Microbacterium sp. SORGH_AS_0862]
MNESADLGVPPGRGGVFWRLSAMMLFHFIAFGAWFSTLGLVLATHGMADIIGLAYSSASLGAIVATLFVGALIDRWLGAKVVLGASHLICAALMISLYFVVPAGLSGTTIVLLFVYMFVYMPNMAVTNTIAISQIGARSNRFPYVRVFGTLGFVVAGLLVGQLGLSASPGVFLISAEASTVMTVYAMTLPRTAPSKRAERFSWGDLVGVRAFRLFRTVNFSVFAICALLIGIPLGVYTAYASPFIASLGVDNVASVLAIGPLSEIVFIILIPLVLRWLGMKWALFAGMAMWAIRLLLFVVATGAGITPAIVAVAMHGICNDFFMVLGAMYVSRICPPSIIGQGQALFQLIFTGIGTFLGSLVGNELYNRLVGPEASPEGWAALWWVGIIVSIIASLLWGLLFSVRRDRKESAAASVQSTASAAV